VFKICDVKVRYCWRRRMATLIESGMPYVYKRGKGCFSPGIPPKKAHVPITYELDTNYMILRIIFLSGEQLVV